MKNIALILFFALFALTSLEAQRGYGFPAQDLRNPPDTGMVMVTKRWPATSTGTNAAFWEYWSLTPAGGGGSPFDATGIRDSIAFLYGNQSQPDTAQQVVYKPGHGFDPSLCPGGILPLTENFNAATAANAEDLPFTYAIGTRGPDSLVIKSSGFYTSTAHDLAVGQVYYQKNDPCDLGLSPGTISAPVLLVIDANTIQLIDRSGTPGSDAVRIWIPSSQFTSRGDDPAAPLDSTVGAIALLYQSAGLARPGAIFVYQLPAGTNNPTYTAASGLSSFPARAWYWDGLRATRITNAGIAVDMQADSVGNRVLIPATSSDAPDAYDFLVNNYQDLPMPNGTLLYWKGSGNNFNPDTIYQVVDNPTIPGGQGVILVKSLASGGNGIYGGSGKIQNGTVATMDGEFASFKIAYPTGNYAIDIDLDGIGGLNILNPSANANITVSESSIGIIGFGFSFLGQFPDSSFIFTDQRPTTVGIQYNADYSANYTARSLPDKNYVDTRLGGRALLNTTAPTAGQTYLWDAVDARFEIGTPGGASPTDLSFAGSASPVTLNSSTGTDVTLTAGTNTTFSQASNNLTINAANADLTFTGASSPFTLASSTGSDVTFVAGTNVALSRSVNALTISATGDGNGIYSGSDFVSNGTTATLLGRFSIANAGGAGLYLNQGTNTHYLGQAGGTRVLVAPTLNRIELYGDGTTPAQTYLYDADASAPVIVRVPSVVNGGGYIVEWPATAPAVGESLKYTGSNTYDWTGAGPVVYFSGRVTTGYSVSGTAANVVFDTSTVIAGVTVNEANGSFTATDARVYDLIYSVSFTYPDGTADTGSEFWIEVNGTPLEETRMRASRLTAAVGTLGNYTVTGNTIVRVPASGVIRLRSDLDSPDTDFIRASFTGKSLN